MKAGPKLTAGAAVLVAAAGLLGVLYHGARHRALVSYCRNNLRHLGGLAVKNWGAVEQERTGRLFWQAIREEQYHAPNGKWSVPPTEPFTCPVLGRGPADPNKPESIDYLGPRRLRPSARETPKDEPIGADRPGNHPSGGLVLRLDTSVEAMPAGVSEERDDAWESVLKVLKD